MRERSIVQIQNARGPADDVLTMLPGHLDRYPLYLYSTDDQVLGLAGDIPVFFHLG